MSKKLTVKATKQGRTVTQDTTSPSQKQRWIELFQKNGWRVIADKA